jgi:tetratricopeptide (TPR) repeat protein
VSEVIFRVGPLAVPQPDCNDIEILRCSAVDLFLSRAKSPQNRVGSDSKEIRLVGDICRRLDGIPLAIELAAARLHSLGVEGVHRHLDDRMAILGGGYRTALPRHQTLRATFDWSFALLDANTRMLFRRLALFGARFTFEGMCAVVCDQKLSIASAISGIGELVAKSLVTAEFEGPVAQYRLSESARAYALEKLQAEGERKEVAARNARYLSTRIQTRLEERHRSGRATSSEIQSSLEDARNAYEWAFSTEGDALLGIELASNLACALFDCGLLEECCACASHAVDAIDNMPPKSVDVISEMRLRTALAMALPYVRGTISALVTLWQQVLRLATEADDVEYQARAIWGLWNTMISRADIHAAKSYATQFRSLTLERGTPWQQVLARQLCAILRHFQGHHAEAKAELLRAREQYMQHHAGVHHAGSFYVEPLVFCNGSLARIAWLQGDPDAAMALADDLVNLVRPAAMEPSLTHVLGATAIPLALMSGDLQRSAHYIKVMRSQAALHGFEIWRDYCNCLSANHDILEGRIKQGLAQLSASLDSLVARGFRRVITPLIVACAEAMTAMGQTAQARERLDAALTYCNNHDECLFLPEVWRALGAVARAEAEAPGQTIEARSEKVAQADACFHTAIDLARAHGAVMFELRASIALAGLLKAEGRIQATLDLLVGLSTQFNRNSTATDIRVLFEMMHDLQFDTAQPTPRNPRMRSKRELHSIDH